MTTKPLIDEYHEMMVETWKGTENDIPTGLIKRLDGSVVVVFLDLTPEQAYESMLGMIVTEQATEAVFALDRFTQPDQGTKWGDVLAGHYFAREREDEPFRPFVIEYEKDLRVFEPVDYGNEFWNRSLKRELVASMRNMVREIVASALS